MFDIRESQSCSTESTAPTEVPQASASEASDASASVVRCWEVRGCDDEMMGRCPHNTPGEPCPADCHYAACIRKTHVVCDDFEVLLNPSRDYDMAVKEICRFCTHFLVNGPDIEDRPEGFRRQGNPNRFLL